MNDPTNSKYKYLSFTGGQSYRRFIQNDKDQGLTKAATKYYTPDNQAHGTYGALLFDPRWKSKRKEILERDGHACVICKHNKNTQVHHRQYHFVLRDNKFKDPWDYAPNFLITLCESCHKRGHSKYKVPIINL